MDYLKAAVAMLICGKEQGTAFLVSNTLALTMTHCVTDAIENGEDIILAFKNIPGQDEINIKASNNFIRCFYINIILKMLTKYYKLIILIV